VRQASGGCPLSRVGHVSVEDGTKNPGESRQVITSIVQYVWTREILWLHTTGFGRFASRQCSGVCSWKASQVGFRAHRCKGCRLIVTFGEAVIRER
jgi:hypothetical protein